MKLRLVVALLTACLCAVALAPVRAAPIIGDPVADLGLYAVAGTVTDGDGRPVAGAVVSDGTRWTLTDDAGAYRLRLNAPGTYVFDVTKSEHDAVSKQVTFILPDEHRWDVVLRRSQ